MINFPGRFAMSQHLSQRIDYEGHLNPSQLEAVTAAGSPILVIAGAGSGKTRTIVYRVAWLVEQGIDPASILLLTFTRKAAQEMLSRAAELLDGRVSRVSGGTFHSTGNLILRRYGRLIGFDASFSIMDQGDSIEALDEIRKSLSQRLDLPKGFPRARTISDIISRARGSGETIEDGTRSRYPHLVPYVPQIEAVETQYREHKLANNLMDYDDLLLNTVRLMTDHERIRNEIAAGWTHILVDEYQDTNRLQAQMLRLLATGHDNVMAVGDDSQSIYSFRGAEFRNIIDFPNIFMGTKIVKLEENYRSTAAILAVTNAIVQGATTGYAKRLYTRKTEGPKPLAARPADERGQSRFVVQCVKELETHGIPLRDVAVLFRAGFHSFDLEGELGRNGISFVKYGGFKFLESLHIKDVLAYLKVINNPRDRLSWSRILKTLPGVGPKTAMKLAGQIAERRFPLDCSDLTSPKVAAGKPFQDLVNLVAELKEQTGPISEKVDRINLHYFSYLQEHYDNYPKRMRDLEQLADLTASYRSLNRFLNDMALEPPDEDRGAQGRTESALVLSTIHSAKGLEWHTVIVIWATEGRIPSPMAEGSPEEMEEERRLLYVATTRAKHNLVVVAPRTYIDRNKGVVGVRLSRFLEEVPEEYFRIYVPG
jgi:DNA helicase-2/ATP-dependent DNA helicase PcrA